MAIAEYIAQRNQSAAYAVQAAIRQQVGRLAEHPRSGRPGRVKGTSELVVSGTPYRRLSGGGRSRNDLACAAWRAAMATAIRTEAGRSGSLAGRRDWKPDWTGAPPTRWPN